MNSIRYLSISKYLTTWNLTFKVFRYLMKLVLYDTDLELYYYDLNK